MLIKIQTILLLRECHLLSELYATAHTEQRSSLLDMLDTGCNSKNTEIYHVLNLALVVSCKLIFIYEEGTIIFILQIMTWDTETSST